MRQDIELQRTRVLVSAIMQSATEPTTEGDKQMRDLWNDYVVQLLPFRKNSAKTQDQLAIEFLREQVKLGPLKVVPLTSLNKRRR